MEGWRGCRERGVDVFVVWWVGLGVDAEAEAGVVVVVVEGRIFGQTTSIVSPELSSRRKIVRVGSSSREIIRPARWMNWMGWFRWK